jgi:hypothetical protein
MTSCETNINELKRTVGDRCRQSYLRFGWVPIYVDTDEGSKRTVDSNDDCRPLPANWDGREAVLNIKSIGLCIEQHEHG